MPVLNFHCICIHSNWCVRFATLHRDASRWNAAILKNSSILLCVRRILLTLMHAIREEARTTVDLVPLSASFHNQSAFVNGTVRAHSFRKCDYYCPVRIACRSNVFQGSCPLPVSGLMCVAPV